MDNEWAKSFTDLQRHLAVSLGKLAQLKKEKGFPRKTQKGYNVSDCKKFLETLNQNTGKVEELDLKTQKLEHEVAILRLERLQKEKQLAPVDLIKQSIVRCLTPVKSLIQHLPKKGHLCNPSDPLQAEQVLREEVDRIFEAIRTALEQETTLEDHDKRGGNTSQT